MSERINEQIRQAAGKGRAVSGVESERQRAEKFAAMDPDELMDAAADASATLEAALGELVARLQGESGRAEEEEVPRR